jgi:hypothetical protein
MSGAAACCCGGCAVTDCLSGDTTDTGCCRGCDDLLLWCERPSYGFTQQAVSTGFGPGAPKCQWNYTVTSAGLAPVQAIYRYYGTRWRCAIPPTTPESLYPIPQRCPEDYTRYGLGVPLCYPDSYYLCNGSTSHCNDPSPPICLCSSLWLTPYRKAVLSADPATKWLVEMTCFKNGQALSGTVGSLYGEFLCLVHREHWWRIPSGECAAGDYLHVPGCVGGTCTGGCGNTTWQTDDLVPKWWIFACSGAPLFRFDLDDAIARGYITAGDKTTVLNAIALGNQPPQGILNAMAQGGYFDTRDWRADQRQAFIELNARFPGAGYAACIDDCADMELLGPIRRRLTAPYQSPPTAVPWLNRDDAEASQQTLNVGAACFIDYPGADNPTDYGYWAARQWVYFRAAPGGWVWAGWNATGNPACSAMSEEEAILHGCGRADPTCIEALKGNPRPAPCCVDNAPICDTETWTPCSSCGNPPPSCPCGAVPLVGCGPFSATPVGTQCENLVISPDCLGVRFVWAQYVNENILAAGEGTCVQTYRYRCLYTAKSYLVEARRSADSWSDACPYQCRRENPPLGTFNAWPPITQGHYGIAPICDSIILNDAIYSSADLCCSGYCWDYTYVPPLPDPLAYPCFDPVGATNDCPATSECPPHSTAGQISCIGFTPPCPP